MAANVGSQFANTSEGSLPAPSAIVMAYTGHSAVSAHESPTFVVAGEQDGIAPPAIMERRVKALRRIGTEVEFHEYRGVEHGFGLGTSAEGWIYDAIRFWKKYM